MKSPARTSLGDFGKLERGRNDYGADNIHMSPFIRLEKTHVAKPRSKSTLRLPLLQRQNYPPFRGQPSFKPTDPVSTQPSASLLVHPSPPKSRYFYLNDHGSLYDISGRRVTAVTSSQDITEAQGWVQPSRSESPEVLLRNMSQELEVRFVSLAQDRRVMQSVKFEEPSHTTSAVTAFREVRLGNDHRVKELVQDYGHLVSAVDAVRCT